MRYLLDSDVVIYYSDGVSSVLDLVDRLAVENLAVSSVTYMETVRGSDRSADRALAEVRLRELFVHVPILAFSQLEAHRCAGIREDLQRQGRRFRQRSLDLMIAATAIEHDLVLVTNNVADYDNILGLQIVSPETL